jgi:glutamate/tyrosine decarboxylase-like PLP-dependent enzyme
VGAAARLVSERTAVVVASAFSYPHGVMDPVADLAALAADHGAACHVDACIGGFVLPFLERLGHRVPPWDFRAPGVTEISADIHKYGYAPKGASVLLHRDPDWVEHRVFLYDAWPAGLYGSPVVAGARPGAPIAAAWALLRALGVQGYTELMAGVMDAVGRLRDFVASRDDLELVGDPIGPVLAMRASGRADGRRVDVGAVAEAMEERGWALNRLTEPPALHVMISPRHVPRMDALLADLADSLARHGPGRGGPVRYA